MNAGSPDDEGFLQRWSRRKRDVVEGQDDSLFAEVSIDEDAGEVLAEPEGDGTAVIENSEEDPELVANREVAEAIDIDGLTYESDFTVFMKKGVPDALKNAALRKLWRSNPILAVVDGLNDYDINYRVSDKILTNFQSAYKVGRGYADKAEEIAAEMEAKSAQLALEREAEAQSLAQSDAETVRLKDVERDETDLTEMEDGSSSALIDQDPDMVSIDPREADLDDEPVRKVSIRRRMAFDVDQS